MKKLIKVALNMSNLSVPEKINKGRFIVETMIAAGNVFPNPLPNLGTVTIAINNLENAWNDAADGGKQKTAFMHEVETEVMKLFNDLAHYVERIANGDTKIVVASGMEVKKDGVKHIPEFEVEAADYCGAVKLRVKPEHKTVYRWEYCKDPLSENNWTEGVTTDVCMTNLGGLEQDTVYWFRVVFINKFGVTIPYPPKNFLVD